MCLRPLFWKPTERPHGREVVVVDAAQFYPGYKGQVGFSVLAAYGYAERGDPGRVVALRAITGAPTMRHWQALFGSLNGSPLIRVRLNRADRFDDYLRAIADHLHQPTTQPVPQRLLNDPPGQPSLHPF